MSLVPSRDGWRRLTVRGPSGELSVTRAGEGAPVILLHPLALSGEVWGEFAESLARSFDVLAVDARGHGRSDWDGAAFTMDDLADDVIAVMDALSLDRVHLVGMSMGGSTAMTVAGRRPARVERLVLADTTAWYGEQAEPVWAERAQRAADTERPQQVPFQVDRWFTREWASANPDAVQRVVDVFLGTASAAHAAASTAMGALDARELLPAITAPTLSLTGEEDYATPPEMGRYVADHVRRGRFVLLPGLRHLSLVERPELADDVAAHLRGRDREEVGQR